MQNATIKAYSLAQAIANRHKHEPLSGVSLPVVAWCDMDTTRVLLDDGKTVLVMAMTTQQFRAWYQAIIDLLYTGRGSRSPRIFVIWSGFEEKPDLDKNDRWYLLDELCNDERFRKLALRLFAEEEEKAA